MRHAPEENPDAISAIERHPKRKGRRKGFPMATKRKDEEPQPDWSESDDQATRRDLPNPEDYRLLGHDYPPGGETTREQGFGAPSDEFPPASDAVEEYVDTPASSDAASPREFVPLPTPGETPEAPPEAIDVMTEERSDTEDPLEEMERLEEDERRERATASPTEEESEARLDEAIDETFPASDPISRPRADR